MCLSWSKIPQTGSPSTRLLASVIKRKRNEKENCVLEDKLPKLHQNQTAMPSDCRVFHLEEDGNYGILLCRQYRHDVTVSYRMTFSLRASFSFSLHKI